MAKRITPVAQRRAGARRNGVAAPAVLLADDHPLFRDALRLAVLKLFPAAHVIEADSFAALKEAAARHAADLALLDLMMPGAEGFSSLLHLRREYPRLRVAVISGVEEALCIRSALALGAVAYLPKSLPPRQMRDVLRTVLEGGSWHPPGADAGAAAAPEERAMAERLDSLSRQELRILLALGDGRMNKQIGHEIGISEGTVKVHMKAILRKLGLARRTQAALVAQRMLKAEPNALAGLHEAALRIGG